VYGVSLTKRFGPISVKVSPCSTRNETLLTAMKPPKRFTNPFTVSTPDTPLVHDPEKPIPAFRKDHARVNKRIERDDDSKKVITLQIVAQSTDCCRWCPWARAALPHAAPGSSAT